MLFRSESILVRLYTCFAGNPSLSSEQALQQFFNDEGPAENTLPDSYFNSPELPASLVKDHLQREEVYRLSGIATFSAVFWLIVGVPSCLLSLAPQQRLWHKLPGTEKLPDQAKEFSTLSNNV